MIIRRASVEDAAAICAVHQAAARKLAACSYTPEQIEAWVGTLTPASYSEVLLTRELIVADEGGEVVGFGQLDLAVGEIEAVYVAPSVAGTGVGGAILDALETIATNYGVEQLHLRATLNAVWFYAHAGYVADAEVMYRTPSGVELTVVSMSKLQQSFGE